jgi:hypothetical protein
MMGLHKANLPDCDQSPSFPIIPGREENSANQRRPFMARTAPSQQTLSDCIRMQSMWKENPSFRLNDINLDQYDGMVRQIQTLTQSISDAEARMTDARIRRKALLSQASDVNTRLRSAARGYFGVDAVQLKQTGAKLRSERKAPSA